MPRNTQNNEVTAQLGNSSDLFAAREALTSAGDYPVQPARDYRRDMPMTDFASDTDDQGSEPARATNTMQLTYRDTGDLELNAINVIKQSLTYLETRQKVRVLRYMLDRSDNQSAQFEDMPF